MNVTQDQLKQLLKSKMSVGLSAGMIVGGLVGLVAGGTVYLIFGDSLMFSAGVVAAFTIIFAGYGSFMGLLFDVDAREREAGRAISIPASSEQVGRERIKTTPLALPR
jgi:hypothetical protein